MKFTHREIEEDRKKPVGSLFLHLLDRDSMPPRRHRNAEAGRLNTHSLPHTQLSLYARDPPQRTSTPLRGRRHFAIQGRHVDLNREEYTRPPTGLRRGASPHASVDHIGGNMTPRASADVSTPRQRRHIPPPSHGSPHRPFWLGDDTTVGSARSCRAGSADSRAAYSRNSSTAQHLTVGSLVPLPERPIERPPPPPPVPAKQRTTGIRLFPEQRSRSVDDVRRGIRMVAPQPHWRSASDRQWDFLDLGVARRETPVPLYRNESHIDVGGGPIIKVAGSEAAAAASPSPTLRWRGGRRYSVSPASRTFDIITGRPLVH
ncbi:hypothetical protein NESM_000169200 [Novymonas esmeraldas]|uniref:Uncharacterized protein n=1 Tax=Novymonas esmeraldas TaxID=1808958 RepID=A0AAW0F4F8_9TRYP